jgi:hypothetical protein
VIPQKLRSVQSAELIAQRRLGALDERAHDLPRRLDAGDEARGLASERHELVRAPATHGLGKLARDPLA